VRNAFIAQNKRQPTQDTARVLGGKLRKEQKK